MTTSGTTTFSVTMSGLIYGAFQAAYIIAGTDILDPADYNLALNALNMMVKSWGAKGIGLWLNQLVTISLTASTTNYLLGPGSATPMSRPLAILEARLRTASGADTPLTPMSRNEYLSLTNKSLPGTPLRYAGSQYRRAHAG